MKLTARDAAAYFHAPDRSAAGLLLFGADAMRVALKRQDVIEKLLGPGAEEEMRLTRIPASELRGDKAMLAADGLAPVIKDALTEWREGDAQIIVNAKALAPKSALRKLFESHKRAYAIGIYDEPPSRAEIEETLAKSGVTDVGRDGMAELTALAQALDPGDFRQTMEKLALYKMSDPSPVTSADIMACPRPSRPVWMTS